MRNTKIALAVLALVASTAAMAEVQISGRVEAGAQAVSGTGSNNSNTFAGYNLAGSELRVTGSEELEGGLKASFYLASGFDLAAGRLNDGGEATQSATLTGTSAGAVTNTSLFNRGAYVSLAGAFGTVSLGRQYTPTTLVYGTGDPNAGNSNHVLHMVRTGMAANFWADRAITYTSPSVAGLTGSVQYGTGDMTNSAATTGKTGSDLGYSVTYNAGDVNVGAAQFKNGCNSGTQDGYCWTSSVYGANYTMGDLTLGAGGTSTKAPIGPFSGRFSNGVDMRAVHTGAAGASSGYFAGVSYKLGATALGVSYYTNKEKLDVKSSSLWAFSARHGLSKNTTLFAQYNIAGKQTDNSGYASNYNGLAADSVKGSSAFFTGLLVNF
jgi:predicted porin